MKEGQSQSSITLSQVTAGGDGVHMNGCLIPQHRWVDIIVKDPSGNEMVRASLAFDQLAHMLVSNTSTPCTLTRYRDESGKLAKEEVPAPKSIMARATEAAGKSGEELGNRMDDMVDALYAMVNGGSTGKKAMEDVLRLARTLRDNYKANIPHQLHVVQEEAAKVQDSLRIQLSTLLIKEYGVEVNNETLRRLEGQPDDVLLLPASEATPVTTDYQKAAKVVKPVDKMTAMEVGDQLSIELKRIEAGKGKTKKGKDELDGGYKGTSLYNAFARGEGTKVHIQYVSYQGNSKMALDVARRYLAYLRSVKDYDTFRQHHHFEMK